MRAPGTSLDGRPLGEGMHDIGGAGIRVDRRGHWLLLDEAAPGVHVNGRPVARTALLRPGDSLHVGGQAILLAGTAAPAPPESVSDEQEGNDGRVLLRAIGGRHHGRGFTLDQPRVIGSDPAADIRLDPPLAARHARLSRERGRVVLRGIAAGHSVVNGEELRDAELFPGDQLLFGGRDRFVLEAPSRAPVAFDDEDFRAATRPAVPAGDRPLRLPWLLLAALLIAAALSAFLLL